MQKVKVFLGHLVKKVRVIFGLLLQKVRVNVEISKISLAMVVLPVCLGP